MSTGFPTVVEIAHEARDRAVRQVLDLEAEMLQRVMGSKGRTFGTEDMDRGTRIEMVLADEQSGALDILRTISPKFYDEYVAQYERDMKAQLTSTRVYAGGV